MNRRMNQAIDIDSNTSNKYKDLNNKELFKLFKDNRDREIRNELVHRYIYIIEILAKKYINKGIDYEDIYQVASLGLIFAIERFDVDKGFEFSSFATPTIIGEIKKYFRDKGWSVRVPRRIQELSKKINVSKQRLQQDLQRVPRVKDIAELL
jgi:RNA polymerase sigma-B factor